MQVSRGPAKVSESIVRWRQVYPISKQKVSKTTKGKSMQVILRDQNNQRLVLMHQVSMGMRCCTDSYHDTQNWMRVRLIPAQSTMKFVIRLCASEVDRKSIHSDVYHEGRWLLWYLMLSQTITMQSVHTPCRPPPAAETTLRNDLRIREYCFGTETARAKSGEQKI